LRLQGRQAPALRLAQGSAVAAGVSRRPTWKL
jgi:hypothetical protein